MESYIFNIKTIKDARGSLSSLEGNMDVPIEIKRIFFMHNVNTDRGGHAHIDTDQVLIALSGKLKVKLFDGKNTKEYIMDDCTKGLYIPRLVFIDLYNFSTDAVCLVLANTHYDMKKSLRNISEYLEYLKTIGNIHE
jgi:dTDP-4-dehydrorhamnose 3,5-epimerase-like enzyme